MFARYTDAAPMLNMATTDVSFLVVHVEPGTDLRAIVQELRAAIPNVSVQTTADFAAQATAFWIVQTGAGGGILVAAVLRFVVGVAVVTQTMYAAATEGLSEFATLHAIGASEWTLAQVIGVQSRLIPIVGGSCGVAVAIPLIQLG